MQNNFQQNSLNSMYAGQHMNVIDINITKILFVPTKQYKDVYRRPFEMNVNAGTLNNLENIIGQQVATGGRVNAVSLANTVPDLMKISDIPTERINIANGWGTVRLRFLMEVESHDPATQALTISYVQGYSEYHDPSMSGRIDPNMSMYINSITNVVRTVNHQGMVNTRVLSSFNVLYDAFNRSYSIEDTTISHRLMRPKDVAGGMEVNNIMGNHEVPVNNTRNLYGSIPLESKRLNSVGSMHVSSVINSFILGSNMAEIGHSNNDIFGVASSDLNENNLSEVPLIQALSSLSGDIVTVEFSLNALARLQPDIESKLILVDNNTPMFKQNATILDTDVTADLSTSSIEGTIAVTISEAVSSLLVDEMLSSIDFSITNMTPNSEVVEAVSNVKSFIHGIDVSMYVERFMGKFKALVVNSITKNNLLGVEIFIHADVLGDTTIAVSINGQAPVVYRLPTFCNSLYTSMVGDENTYNNVVDDFSQIMNISQIV